MKKITALLPIFVLVACAGPKYTASFQPINHPYEHSNVYNATPATKVIDAAATNHLVASAKTEPALHLMEVKKDELKTAFQAMSKTERKEVRQLVKKQLKNIVKNQKKEVSVTSTKASGIDHDLKLAAIFGAVGIVGLLLGSAGSFFTVIGAIAMIIGVVFFVKWLIRQ